MGSPACEWGHPLVAEDQVAVTLTHGFEVRQHETTQAEWTALGFDNPSTQDKNGNDCPDAQCPVGHVDWFEALAFANALSTKESLPPCYVLGGCSGAMGHGMSCSSVTLSASSVYDCPGYRLLTDAEYEYAARAGTRTAFYSGDIQVYPQEECATDPNLEAIAWYCYNSGGVSHTVEGKRPNAWGLYDTLGNVDEWDNDRYRGLPVQPPATDPGAVWSPSTDGLRILRGCGYSAWSTLCRAAYQYAAAPSGRALGFRLARTLSGIVSSDASAPGSDASHD
jgi:formylglycine-generating enzyme required for sulfatase activity